MSELKPGDIQTVSPSGTAKLILEVLPGAMRTIRKDLRKLSLADLTVPQFRVMAMLDRSPANNRDIAEWMEITAPTATRMVDSLLRRGLVTRSHGAPTDGRKVTVQLTAKGQARLAEIRSQVQVRLTERLADLSDRKKRALTSGLAVLAELFPHNGPHRRLK